jgi:hypothetical protein
MRVATAYELLEEIPEPRVKSAVGRAEALVPDAQELLVVLLDQVFELVGGAVGGEGERRTSPNPSGGYRLGGRTSAGR